MNEKWDKRFMELAKLVSSWSKDPSTKVGTVLVRDRKIVSTGYNGFPTGIADDERLNDRPKKYPLVIHAEMNALIQAGINSDDCTLYLYGFPGPPCQNCSKHVIQAGIIRIVHQVGDDMPDRWSQELEEARNTLKEAGVRIDTV